MGAVAEMVLDGRRYVVLPMEEYHRLRGEVPPDAVDAIAYAAESIARCLREARKLGDLTQVELAAKLNVSQTMVARAEAGRVTVGEAYMRRVLKACKLPKHWKPE